MRDARPLRGYTQWLHDDHIDRIPRRCYTLRSRYGLPLLARSAGQRGLLRPENANCHAGHREVGWHPSVPSSAHEEWRPSVLVELRTPEVDEKNCETNPITSAGILVVPEIEWQRNPASSSAGSCQKAYRRAGAILRKLRGRCAQRWIRRRLASTWSAPAGISILPSCSKLSVSYTAMSPMVPPT
jgi:hypothetical protein